MQPGAWDSMGGLGADASPPSVGPRRDTKETVSSWEGSCPEQRSQPSGDMGPSRNLGHLMVWKSLLEAARSLAAKDA